jgi:hypothetical protein
VKNALEAALSQSAVRKEQSRVLRLFLRAFGESSGSPLQSFWSSDVSQLGVNVQAQKIPEKFLLFALKP